LIEVDHSAQVPTASALAADLIAPELFDGRIAAATSAAVNWLAGVMVVAILRSQANGGGEADGHPA
jgi:hypothetical protein